MQQRMKQPPHEFSYTRAGAAGFLRKKEKSQLYIFPLRMNIPKVPDFDCSIFSAGNYPLPLDVKRNTSDVITMALEHDELRVLISQVRSHFDETTHGLI
jgi:hypothetical protein